MTAAFTARLTSVYRHNSVVRRLTSKIRQARYRQAALAKVPPFNGDRFLDEMVNFLLSKCEVKQFIETGTYLGFTCRQIAARFPQLPITTMEVNEDFYTASKSVLRQFDNVQQLLGNSAQSLEQLLQTGLLGLSLFFLDAHWYDYLPLPDEIHSISRHMQDAIMLIHDFKIPGRDDYGFDVCQGKAIDLEMLRASVLPERFYTIYLPKYAYQEAFALNTAESLPMKGHALVFQNATEAAHLFAASEIAQRYQQVEL